MYGSRDADAFTGQLGNDTNYRLEHGNAVGIYGFLTSQINWYRQEATK